MEGSLFRFPFCFGDVLKVASTIVASLTKISGDFSFCCFVSILLVETVSTGFMLPVEIVFMLPVESVFILPVEAILVYLARCVFPLNSYLVALVVPSFVWTFSILFSLLCNHFSLSVYAIVPPIVLGLATWPFPHFSLCYFCGGLSYVSLPLAFSPASVCSLSSLLDEVSSSAIIRISSSLDMLWKIFEERGTV